MRRYAPLKPSRGTVIPPDLRQAVLARDNWTCVGKQLGWSSHLAYQIGGTALELDHVRASGGLGLKSRTAEDNLISLCSWCHREKTLNGRQRRPELLAYLAALA